MKLFVVLYSAFLIFYGGIMLFLTLASPHHVDSSLVISNWASIISFTATIYLLRPNIFFKSNLIATILFLVINCGIFIYAAYDFFKTMDDDSDKTFGLLPVTGLLFSFFFLFISFVEVFKAQKG